MGWTCLHVSIIVIVIVIVLLLLLLSFFSYHLSEHSSSIHHGLICSSVVLVTSNKSNHNNNITVTTTIRRAQLELPFFNYSSIVLNDGVVTWPWSGKRNLILKSGATYKWPLTISCWQLSKSTIRHLTTSPCSATLLHLHYSTALHIQQHTLSFRWNSLTWVESIQRIQCYIATGECSIRLPNWSQHFSWSNV